MAELSGSKESMRAIALVLLAFGTPSGTSSAQAIPDSTTRIVAEAIAHYRSILPIRSARFNWCKVTAMRSVMPDSAELCAPWKTVELPPDTGVMAYVQPFDVYSDFIDVQVHVSWRGWAMQEVYRVRKNPLGFWGVETYSVTYLSRQ